MRKFLSCLLAVILFTYMNGRGQSFADTAARIDDYFKELKADEPGGVLIISRHGKEIYHKEFGYSNLSLATSINNQTIFEAASVSKQFTATAVLLLVRNGLLSLDDDIRKYIPELPDYGDVIKIRHLLTHTSGLKDWRNITYITSLPNSYRLYKQADALALICKQKSLNYRPGSAFSYTNSGFDLLGVLVERITKQRFANFVKDSLLTPAGMTNSRFRGEFTEIIKDMATGYTGSSKKYMQGFTLDETYGAAGLFTTAHDLKNWLEYINGNGAGNEISRMRVERYVLNNGDTIPYAIGGVFVKNIDGIREISHSGLISGYRALTAYYPASGLAVAYISNNRSIMTVGLNARILETFFGKNSKAAPLEVDTTADTYAPSVKELELFTGNFYSEDCDVALKINIQKDRLIAYRAPYDSIVLVPVYRKENIIAFRGFDHGLKAMYLFNTSKKGKVNDFLITLPRAENIPFKRKK